MASIWEEELKEDEIANNEYPTIPAGRYQFEVVKVTGKEYTPKPGSKIGKCAEIDLQLRVEGKDRDVTVFDRLYSDPRTVWKMTAFAKCIGVFEKGMTPGQLLRKSEGQIGEADVLLRPAEGNYPARNEIKSYNAPKEEPEKEAVKPEDLPF